VDKYLLQETYELTEASYKMLNRSPGF
jgi:hypothetical protein